MLLYDSTLRVPLIIARPGLSAATRDEAVSLVDLAPTLLRAAGVTPPAEMRGRDLLGTVRLKPDTTEAAHASSVVSAFRRTVISTAKPNTRASPAGVPLQALTDGRWMTIRAGAAAEVYDLKNDPRQEHDLSASQTAVAAAMAARADAIHASAAAAGTRTISPEAQERLRALGYVASSRVGTSSATRRTRRRTSRPGMRSKTRSSALAGASRRRAASAAPSRRRQPRRPRDSDDYGESDEGGGTDRRGAGDLPPGGERAGRPTRCCSTISPSPRAKPRRTPPGAKAAALHDEATRADQAALTLEPDSAAAHNGLGLLAIDDGKPADAVKAFERAAALDSNNASYWANLGNARRAAGDRAGAEQAYRRALEVDARTADAANGLGVLLVEANQPADAAPWFERAIAAAPDLVEARLNLGIALQQSGQTARAADEYQARPRRARQPAREKTPPPSCSRGSEPRR